MTSSTLLQPSALRALLPAVDHASFVALVRPSRPSDLALARLLSQVLPSTRLHFLTNDTTAPLLRTFTSSPIESSLSSDPRLHHHQLARLALSHHLSDLILPTTRVEHAISTLTRLDACVPNAHVGLHSNFTEMLPEDLLTTHNPLVTVDESVLDTTINSLNLFHHSTLSQVQSATAALGAVSPTAAIHHAATRAQQVIALRNASSELLRSCILDASHWGYVVARRSVLSEMYCSGRGGRAIASHALCRLAMHVSGSPTPVVADDEQVSRLAKALLSRDTKGMLAPVPKGRTVAGVVVRPATGRFAKRLMLSERRRGQMEVEDRRWKYRDSSRSRPRPYRDTPDDLIIITREPDHEGGSLLSTRLRGNPACAPLKSGSGGVYWDNRFVMMAAPVETLDKMNAGGGEAVPFVARDIFLAALDGIGTDHRTELIETSLYARQLRRTDWEKITSATTRVRDFQVPYECIRALPALFQKEPGTRGLGELVASPHLGLSARPDMFFTAVRMPRFRSLPSDIDPGFCELHLSGGDNGGDTRRDQDFWDYGDGGNSRHSRPSSRRATARL